MCLKMPLPHLTSACVLQLANCGLSPETVRALNERGILSLFPIQKHVFDPAASGRDLIGRAKTGSGKTLAFALPVIEGLLRVGPASAASCGPEPAQGACICVFSTLRVFSCSASQATDMLCYSGQY